MNSSRARLNFESHLAPGWAWAEEVYGSNLSDRSGAGYDLLIREIASVLCRRPPLSQVEDCSREFVVVGHSTEAVCVPGISRAAQPIHGPVVRPPDTGRRRRRGALLFVHWLCNLPDPPFR